MKIEKAFWVIATALIYIIAVYNSIIISFFEGIKQYVFVCSDWGKYYTSTVSYLETSYLINVVDAQNEPWWFLFVTNFIKTTWVLAEEGMFFGLLLIRLLTGMLIFIIINHFTKWRVWALIGLLLYLFSHVQWVSFFIHARQTFASFFYLLLVWSFLVLNINKLKYKILSSIILGTIIISHRAILWITFMGLLAYVIFLWSDRKKILSLLEIILLWIMLALPYLSFNIESFKRTIDFLINSSSSSRSTTSIYATWEANMQYGFSVLNGGFTNSIPLVDYIKIYFSISLLLISNIKKILWKKLLGINSFLIALTLYISAQNFFASRLPTTFDLLIIVLVCIVMSRSKIFFLKVVLGVSFILFFIHNPLKILRIDGYTIKKTESSIEFAIKNIPKQNSIIFGSQCIMDLFQQLDYKTPVNYELFPVAKIKEIENSGLMSTTDFFFYGTSIWNFLGDKKIVLPSFMQNKNSYLILSNKYWNSKEINSLKKIKKINNFMYIWDFPTEYFLNKILELKWPYEYSDEKNYYQSILKNIKKF